MSAPLALPARCPAEAHEAAGVAVGAGVAPGAWRVGGVLALLPVAPLLVSPWIVVDWTDTAQAGVIAVLQLLAVLAWRADRHAPRGVGLPRAWTWLLGAWGAAMLASTALAADTPLALVRTAAWTGHLAFAAMVLAEARAHPARTHRAVEWGAGAGLVLVVATVAAEWGSTGGAASARDWMYAMPLVGGVRWLSIYGLVGVGFGAAGWLAADATVRRRWASLALLALGWMAIWWGASRAALGGAVLASLLAIAGTGAGRWRVMGGIVCAAALGALCTLLMPLPGIESLLGRFASSAATPDPVGFASGRTAVWGMIVEAWRAAPWLGRGPGSSVLVLSPIGNGHAHNVGLEALVEWGLVGAVPFLALLAALLVRVLRQARPTTWASERAAGLYLVAGLAAAQLDGLTNDPATTALLATAAALVLARCAPEPSRLPGRRTARHALGLVAAGSALLVMSLHLASLWALWKPAVPSPESGRARLVLALPSHPHLKEVEGWGRAWMGRDPAAAERLAAWGLSTGREPWLFLRLRADLALARGDRASALADAAHAERLHHAARQPLLEYRQHMTR